jgi:hypothetical protein
MYCQQTTFNQLKWRILMRTITSLELQYVSGGLPDNIQEGGDPLRNTTEPYISPGIPNNIQDLIDLATIMIGITIDLMWIVFSPPPSGDPAPPPFPTDPMGGP